MGQHAAHWSCHIYMAWHYESYAEGFYFSHCENQVLNTPSPIDPGIGQV